MWITKLIDLRLNLKQFWNGKWINILHSVKISSILDASNNMLIEFVVNIQVLLVTVVEQHNQNNKEMFSIQFFSKFYLTIRCCGWWVKIPNFIWMFRQQYIGGFSETVHITTKENSLNPPNLLSFFELIGLNHLVTLRFYDENIENNGHFRVCTIL